MAGGSIFLRVMDGNGFIWKAPLLPAGRRRSQVWRDFGIVGLCVNLIDSHMINGQITKAAEGCRTPGR